MIVPGIDADFRTTPPAPAAPLAEHTNPSAVKSPHSRDWGVEIVTEVRSSQKPSVKSPGRLVTQPVSSELMLIGLTTSVSAPPNCPPLGASVKPRVGACA